MKIENLRLAWLNIWTSPFQLIGYLLGYLLKALKIVRAAIKVGYEKGRDI